jgi:hypothetical protein
MDYNYMHDMCPIDKLVVCKQQDKSFNMSKLDEMLMGFWMNVDNSALDQCQNIINEKMKEVCGSTTDCNKFLTDDVVGTNSLKSQKVGNVYRVTGMISFGSLKMGDASGNSKKLKPGELDAADYMKNARAKSSGVSDAESILTGIDAELANISGIISKAVSAIEQDQKVQYCITGRDLSQINGKGRDENNMTQGRFPHLLDSPKMLIAASALKKAQENYDKKFNQEVADATKDASADLAQYMCQKMASSGGGAGTSEVDTPLAPPYSIAYDVGAGLTAEDLLKGGSGVTKSGGGLNYSNKQINLNGAGGSTTTTNAVFNRDTRTCHICKSTVTENCEVKGGNWFRKANVNCATGAPVEKCEDVKM